MLIKSLFLSNRFFQILAGSVLLFLLEYFYPVLAGVGQIVLIGFLVLLGGDLVLLYRIREGVEAERTVPQRLSNGDENTIRIRLKNNYLFTINVGLIDEIPSQFQIRDFLFERTLNAGEEQVYSYTLRPVERGEYRFGKVLIYAGSPLGLIKRRYILGSDVTVPVYPSFVQMRKFEMYAFSNRITDIGIKRIRRVGHTMEFDQIKEYVRGDDVRSINWKATARSAKLMVNQYEDERSQQVVSVIDLGRVMKSPFDGLRLLDYAINTSLVISNIALIKEDKAGLIAFSNKDSVIVKPQKKRTHIRRIQEALYNLKTRFLESGYERLIISLNRHIHQRSLVLLYTNFETLSGMERQLPYLQHIARDHLLVAIFFENTELTSLLERTPKNTGEIYTKTVAEQFNFEKRQIVKALNQRGIHTILTPPKELSVHAINKYLELKARGLI